MVNRQSCIHRSPLPIHSLYMFNVYRLSFHFSRLHLFTIHYCPFTLLILPQESDKIRHLLLADIFFQPYGHGGNTK